MKRTLAAITTIVLAAALSVAGVAAGAAADEATPGTANPGNSDAAAPGSTAVTPSQAAGTPAAGEPGDQADKAKADKEKADKDKADKEKADKEKADKDHPAPADPVTGPPAVLPGNAENVVHVAAPVAPICLPDSALAYTYDATNNTGTVTVTDVAGSTHTLCTPLYLTAVAWKYTTNAVWPQVLDRVSNVKIDAAGTYSYGVTPSCGQGDIYASTAAFTEPTPTIDGPKNWEHFLSGFIYPTTTPGFTYMLDPVECYTTIVTIDGPQPVTFADSCGVANDLVSIPTPTAGSHYTYEQTDGRVSGVGTVTATAVADAGFVFATGTVDSWSHEFKSDASNKCVVPADPEAVPQTCAETDGDVVSGYITVAPTYGVIYTIHPVSPAGSDIPVTSGTTQVAPGDYVVTAAAKPGYTLTGTTSWNRTVEDQAVDCDLPTHAFLPSSVTSGNKSCTASGYIGIDPSDGLSYFLGTTKLTSARTIVTPGTYTVTAVADPGDAIDGPSEFTVTVEDQAVDCDLPTHAFLPSSVTSGNKSCTASGYIGIDPGDGLSYFLGTTKLTSARTTVTPGTYKVTAVADPGDAIDGPSEFTVTVEDLSASCAQLTTLALASTGPTGINGYLAGSAGLLLLGVALTFLNQARRKAQEN